MIWRAWAPRSRAESGKAIRGEFPFAARGWRRSPPPGLQRSGCSGRRRRAGWRVDAARCDGRRSAGDRRASSRPARWRRWARARPKRNVWDSPLLLVGGGLFGVMMIAFLALLYALTRGTAAEVFNKVRGRIQERQLRSRHRGLPSGSSSSIRAIRTRAWPAFAGPGPAASGDRRRQESRPGACRRPKRFCPRSRKKRRHSARPGPSWPSILPEIADGFATQAERSRPRWPARKSWSSWRARPCSSSTIRPTCRPRCARSARAGLPAILDKLKAAQRSIDQDKDLVAAVGKIKASSRKGNAARPTRSATSWCGRIPRLEANPAAGRPRFGRRRERAAAGASHRAGGPAATMPSRAAISRFARDRRRSRRTVAGGSRPVRRCLCSSKERRTGWTRQAAACCGGGLSATRR